MRLHCTVTDIQSLKYFGVTTLPFWGHVTSWITWPLDSPSVHSYWWSIMTMSLSCTVMEMQSRSPCKRPNVHSVTCWQIWYSWSWKTHCRATEHHLPYGITQFCLPPDTGKHAHHNPSQRGRNSIYLLRRVERLSWLDWNGLPICR